MRTRFVASLLLFSAHLVIGCGVPQESDDTLSAQGGFETPYQMVLLTARIGYYGAGGIIFKSGERQLLSSEPERNGDSYIYHWCKDEDYGTSEDRTCSSARYNQWVKSGTLDEFSKADISFNLDDGVPYSRRNRDYKGIDARVDVHWYHDECAKKAIRELAHPQSSATPVTYLVKKLERMVDDGDAADFSGENPNAVVALIPAIGNPVDDFDFTNAVGIDIRDTNKDCPTSTDENGQYRWKYYLAGNR